MVAASLAWCARAEEPPAYGPELQGFDYPAVSHRRFTSQGGDLDMAYIDVAPAKPNGRTAVLRRHLAGDDPRAGRRRLPGDRA